MGEARGRLIVVEGIDGCGKTTQAQRLAARLDAVYTFEPGATELGTALRRLLLGEHPAPIDDRTEALLMVADRAQHVAEVIAPALAAGRWVVSDRFSASTLAYQGYGRGLDLGDLHTLSEWSSGGVAPDLTVLVDVPVETAEERVAVATLDRIESEGRALRRRVIEGYRRLAAEDPKGWVVVDGTATADEVAVAVWHAVRLALGVDDG